MEVKAQEPVDEMLLLEEEEEEEEARRRIGAPKTQIQIPCCLCGTLIYPNAANQCSTCLAQQYDLSSVFGPKRGEEFITLFQCRKCKRYQHTESYFQHHEPESPELKALCLKHIPALQHNKSDTSSSNSNSNSNNISNIQLMDSLWIWTEPHSLRFKLRLTIRAKIGDSPTKAVTVQQRIPVELHVQYKQCPDCGREFTNKTWTAIVQIRQKVATNNDNHHNGPRRNLAIVEMALSKTKHGSAIRNHIVKMQITRNGFDFYFLEVQYAHQLSSFLNQLLPIKVTKTSKMVSEDRKNNTAHMKHTICCDIVSLSRDDLIICDKTASKEGCSVGRLTGRLALCYKISGVVRLVDAAPLRNVLKVEDLFVDLNPEKFYKGEKYFRVLLGGRRLTRFVVMDVELCHPTSPNNSAKVEDSSSSTSTDENTTTTTTTTTNKFEKYAIADVEVARESDFGRTDETFHCTTHLGHILQHGDVVLGFDLVSSVLAELDEWTLNNSFNSTFVLPDVVLVRKVEGVGAGSFDGSSSGMNTNTTTNTTAATVNNDETTTTTTGSRGKAKSSMSKRREKRARKFDKKSKGLEEAMTRLGFNSNDIDDNYDTNNYPDKDDNLSYDEDDHEQNIDKDLSLSWEQERQGIDDPFLQELEMAEKELLQGGLLDSLQLESITEEYDVQKKPGHYSHDYPEAS